MAPLKCRPVRAVSHVTLPAVHLRDLKRLLTALMALLGPKPRYDCVGDLIAIGTIQDHAAASVS